MTERLFFCGDVWIPDVEGISVRALDGLVINLEGPIAPTGKANESKICLSQHPRIFDAAFQIQPVAACLANNHMLDFGADGLQRTILELRGKGIAFFGAGHVSDNFNNPAMLLVGSVQVALLGYACKSTNPVCDDGGWGVAIIDQHRILEDVRKAKKEGAERVIVSLHWGEEEVPLPKPGDVQLAAILLDSVDLVVGHHAHVHQPAYRRKVDGRDDRHVFFGLGNAVFPDFDYKVEGRTFAWAKQRSWNRTGVLVEYDALTNSVDSQIVEQVGGSSLLPTNGNVSTWRVLPPMGGGYSRRFDLYRRFALTRLTLSKAIARPRLPTWSHVKSLFRTIAR